ncbi:MAG: nuclear transport factor 2 family protein [Pseudomonadota bacterium]
MTAHLIALETAVWTALCRGDRAADLAALAPDFLGVYANGFADRADNVGQLDDGPTIAAFDLQEVRVRALGPDHGLVSYRAVFTRIGRDHPETMYVSSIWRREAERWRNVFSQDTPAP